MDRATAGETDGEPLGDVVLHDADDTEVDLAVDGIRHRFRVGRFGDDVWVTSALGTVVASRQPRFVEPNEKVDPGSMIASMPGTSAAKNVSTFSSTSTLAGFIVKPMWVSASTTSFAAWRPGACSWPASIGLVNVSPSMLLGSS